MPRGDFEALQGLLSLQKMKTALVEEELAAEKMKGSQRGEKRGWSTPEGMEEVDPQPLCKRCRISKPCREPSIFDSFLDMCSGSSL